MNYSVHNETNGTVTNGAVQIGHLAGRVKIGRDDAGQHVEVDGMTIQPGDGDVLAKVVAHLEARMEQLTPLLPHTQGAVSEIQSVLDLVASELGIS